MWPTQFNTGSLMALLAGIIAAALVIQLRTVRESRAERLAVRQDQEQLVQLTRENAALSNSLAQAQAVVSAVNAPSQELLSLRSEVRALRRQLQAFQELTNTLSLTSLQVSRPAAGLTAETLRKIEMLHAEIGLEYDRWRLSLDTLRGKAPGSEALVSSILANGLQDALLADLLAQKRAIEARLVAVQETPGTEDPRAEVLRHQLADLRIKIDNRSEGIVRGLEARAESLKASLDALRRSVAGVVAEPL